MFFLPPGHHSKWFRKQDLEFKKKKNKGQTYLTPARFKRQSGLDKSVALIIRAHDPREITRCWTNRSQAIRLSIRHWLITLGVRTVSASSCLAKDLSGRRRLQWACARQCVGPLRLTPTRGRLMTGRLICDYPISDLSPVYCETRWGQSVSRQCPFWYFVNTLYISLCRPALRGAKNQEVHFLWKVRLLM